MSAANSTPPAITKLRRFLNRRRPQQTDCLTAVSLFSGAGLSDAGYELAGFRFLVQVEADATRAKIGEANFPHSKWIADDVRECLEQVVEAVTERVIGRLDLLVATPPCQGMSSSNPSRGKRDTDEAKANEWKNRLLLTIPAYAERLKPRVIVAENVRQVLTLEVGSGNGQERLLDILRRKLVGYELFSGVVNVSDYGVPQDRRRAVIVAIRNDEPWLESLKARKLNPWPRETHAQATANGHSPWITVGQWFWAMQYQKLDSGSEKKSRGTHQLHVVPHYKDDRYTIVKHIPRRSGQSAYENDTCPECGQSDVAEGVARCPSCRQPLRNRPIVLEKGKVRLIKGFKSSYRRMRPDEPAPTVTTNSSHIGSDNKIHPWEHRVLSILECADLQTVPRWYDWSEAFDNRRSYLVRNLIGEAFPTYFTYLHGLLLKKLLNGQAVSKRMMATAP